MPDNEEKTQWTAQDISNYMMMLLVGSLELLFLLPVFYFAWEISAEALISEFVFFRAKLYRSPALGFLQWFGMRDATRAHLFTIVVVVVLYFLLRRMFEALLVQKDQTDTIWNRMADRTYTLIACPVLVLADAVLFFKGMMHQPHDSLWSSSTQASGPSGFSVLIVCVLYLGMVTTIPYLVICFRHRKRS